MYVDLKDSSTLSFSMASSSFLSSNITNTLLNIKACHRSYSSQYFLFNPLCVSKPQEVGRSLPRNGDLSHHLRTSGLKTSSIFHHTRSKRDFAIKCSPEPSGLLQFLPPDNSWIKWLWGLVVIVVPYVVQRLLTWTKGVETAAEAVEKVADTVEKVAEDVEVLAEDVADKLPEDGKLTEVVAFVENVAKETAKDAQLTKDLMDKVEEVDQEVESVITDGSKSPVKVADKDQN